jgi:hypothetical protein
MPRVVGFLLGQLAQAGHLTERSAAEVGEPVVNSLALQVMRTKAVMGKVWSQP